MYSRDNIRLRVRQIRNPSKAELCGCKICVQGYAAYESSGRNGLTAPEDLAGCAGRGMEGLAAGNILVFLESHDVLVPIGGLLSEAVHRWTSRLSCAVRWQMLLPAVLRKLSDGVGAMHQGWW